MVQGTIMRSGPTAEHPAPRRALVISATVGEGHNAVGHALTDVIGQIWPGCEVSWIDALEAMGPGVAPLARATYVMQVERTPWMYEFFFSAIWRHRWFLDSTRNVIGWWCGNRLAGQIRRQAPDVIISTYPLGSAGLSWLRRRGRLDIPTGAWVSDFCPHPYWLYRNLDVTYVMHPRALPVAAAAEPGSPVAVAGLPVTKEFQPADRAGARAGLGLHDDCFVVLLSTGSLGFGNVEQAAAAILDAGPDVVLVAVCGRNERLRARLAAMDVPAERLRVLGWADNMPSWLAAVDALVTNGGGVTVLEAIACGRPVVMFQPIAGHGRANADLMAAAGLAVVCGSTMDLTRAVRGLSRDAAGRDALVEAARERAAGRGPGDDLRALAALPAVGNGVYPVSAQDALFLHAETRHAPQQVGAVVMLAGERVGLAELRSAVEDRAARVPELRRRLLEPRGRWERPRWLVEAAIDVAGRLTEVDIGPSGAAPSLDKLVERFFMAPLDVRRAPWEVLLARNAGEGGRDAFVVKMHHSLGDSFALISALSGLFDPAGAGGAGQAGPAPPRSARMRQRVAAGLGHGRKVVAGLAGMVGAGRAPAGPLSTTAAGPARRFVRFRLPAREVAVTARRMRTSTADLLLALVAGAVGDLFARRGVPAAGRSVRVMVPRTVATRGPRRPGRARWAGNRAAGVLLDLPVGPMTVADRVAAVREAHQASVRRGDAEAAAFVLRAMSRLPQPLQRRCSRAVYTGTWLSLIVSVFPGIRRTCRVLGAEIEEVYPVLALADGAGLAIGAMTWGASMSVGLVADDSVLPDAGLLAEAIQRSFAACAAGPE